MSRVSEVCLHGVMKSWFLGMDIGGTSTRAVLVNPDGRVMGVGRAASANPHNVGRDVVRARLGEATAAAWASAGRKIRPARHAFLGCAGVKSRTEICEMRALAEGEGLAPAGEVVVANDLHNALAGGLSGRPGIAVIAGTGTNCLGRDPRGEMAMCGGWGWLLDDEGGGFGLALAAVRAVARAADGRGSPTSLVPAVLTFFGVSEPDELLSWFYGRKWTPAEVAGFAQVVMRHADAGDEVAGEILAAGARALAGLVSGARRALRFPGRAEVVLLGGCGRSGPPYQKLVERELKSACRGIRLVEPEGCPLAGAAFNALRSGGVDPVPALDHNQFDL